MVCRWTSVALILYSYSLYGWWNVCCDNRPTEARRWSAWSEWSVCNHHCGATGFRFRSRACSLRRGNRTTIRRLCPGNRFEREACVSRLCLLQPDQISTALNTPQQQHGLLNLSSEVTSQNTTTSTPLTSETVFNITNSNISMTTQAPDVCPYFCDSRATTCGRPTYYSPKKIVGGTTSQKNAWPWQVGVWSNQRLLCSATVICSGWVMTSAHCFLNLTTLELSYNGIHLRFGSHTRERIENGAYVRSLNKSQVFLHPMYNIWLKKYDIALVRLDPPLRYSRTVAPACLPDMMKLSVQPGELCYVAGWGTTNGVGPPNTNLKQLLVRVINNDVCKYTYFYSATYMILCVGGERLRDTCAGDSGGALMCQSSTTGRWEVQGIVSFGARNCGREGFPTIYMQVSFFLPWIQSVMRGQCSRWQNI